MAGAPAKVTFCNVRGDCLEPYISAFAGLAGAIIGGLTSFATSWFTQQALRNAGRQAKAAKVEALYNV